MIVGLVGASLFVFYLMAVPVELALQLRTAPAPGFGAGAALFEGRFALKSAEKRMIGEKKHLPWRQFSTYLEKIRRFPALFHALRYAFSHLELRQLCIRGRIGMQDAAATALICGCGEAIGSALNALPACRPMELRLEPDFSGSGIQLQLSGMVSIRAGHIICTALIGAVYSIKERISQWKSTRLRTS